MVAASRRGAQGWNRVSVVAPFRTSARRQPRERAAELARRYGAAVPFAALEPELARADLVLTATACPEHLI
jgi:hypothetical protein